MANYGKEVRMGGDIRRKGKVESATEFAERSRSSIKKNSEGDEEICRQGKKRNGEMEERRSGTIEH